MFGKIIYTKEDEAYFIKRVIPENQFDKPDMKVLKKLFHCDTVLRNQAIANIKKNKGMTHQERLALLNPNNYDDDDYGITY